MKATSNAIFACGLVSIIAFFSILTQRMMITTENSALEMLVAQRWMQGFRRGNETKDNVISNGDISNGDIAGIISIENDGKNGIGSDKLRSGSKKALYSTHVFNGSAKVSHHNLKKNEEKRKKSQKKSISDSMNMTRIIEALNYHPHYSPRIGTDISEDKQMTILNCSNQSKCIVPELQLQVKLKVYFCKRPTRQGVRFYYLMKEGLILHPNVILLEEKDMYDADYVIYLPASAPWHKTECHNVSLANKMIVMDEFDGPTLYAPRPSKQLMVEAYGKSMRWYFMYFKRSFVKRKDGKFFGYPHFNIPDVYPMTYALAEAYLQHNFNFNREIEILCTLRGSKSMTTRQRVQDWVAEYGNLRKVKNVVSKQVTGATRTTVSRSYFEQMFNSSIIVTVNPANWEGDFRLWESFATGALVMVDPLFVPHSYPLLDGVHVIYFSNSNKSDLFQKLDYYRRHPLEARKIAINGYLHAMKYHRTVNLIDYILRSAHFKDAMIRKLSLPEYTFTAQYINNETIAQERAIKKHDRPGSY
eukprot:CAMPEP_0119038306 /NCGR_PEP_ID=MMETSP1177-20130426/7141_1 /TAXON_ID=2985 /ORGANISM="Ochromonas sp, Strain CCMP1899" /LENGTH=529 /DNA_ID=CAMNT_0007000705 /DNA_START=165 /DNA_END=1751 /DNA_ORIENTATION=+